METRVPLEEDMITLRIVTMTAALVLASSSAFATNPSANGNAVNNSNISVGQNIDHARTGKINDADNCKRCTTGNQLSIDLHQAAIAVTISNSFNHSFNQSRKRVTPQ